MLRVLISSGVILRANYCLFKAYKQSKLHRFKSREYKCFLLFRAMSSNSNCSWYTLRGWASDLFNTVNGLTFPFPKPILSLNPTLIGGIDWLSYGAFHTGFLLVKSTQVVLDHANALSWTFGRFHLYFDLWVLNQWAFIFGTLTISLPIYTLISDTQLNVTKGFI